MTLSIGWPELLILAVAWAVVAAVRARAEAASGGGMDVVPGSGTHQVEERYVIEERGRVGFK